MADDKWDMYQDKSGKFRWRRHATNGNIVGSSTQGYASEAFCIANMEHYGYNGKFNPDGKWAFYEDKKGEWRWRHTADNGKIVGGSSEGYNKRSDCLANAKRHGYPKDK